MKSDFIWINGKFVPYAEATVHVLTPTIHYGPGVFEGIRAYKTERGPGVFRLREHMERFNNSIHILGFAPPYSVDELIDAVKETIRRNGFDSCYIRPFMYLDGPLGLNLDASKPVIAIATWEWGAYLGKEAMERGARMAFSSFTRMHPNASMTKAKIGGQYVNSMLAKTLALRMGFDEAIMLDPEGYVAEGSGENLFMVRDDVIYTPYRAGVLEGITRDALITLAQDLGYTIKEQPISRDQLYIADEVFVCGTAAEVSPVREIDFRTIGAGKRGPIAKALQDVFFETVAGKGARSDEWLTFID